MSTTFLHTEPFVVITCYKCSMLFAVPESVNRRWLERRATAEWFCPNGHGQHYVGQTEAQRLRDELTRERARLDQEKAHALRLQQRVDLKERQLRARKGIATKLRKRIASGKCPCCHMQFADLKRHMTTRHPRWDPETAATAIAAKSSNETMS